MITTRAMSPRRTPIGTRSPRRAKSGRRSGSRNRRLTGCWARRRRPANGFLNSDLKSLDHLLLGVEAGRPAFGCGDRMAQLRKIGSEDLLQQITFFCAELYVHGTISFADFTPDGSPSSNRLGPRLPYEILHI